MPVGSDEEKPAQTKANSEAQRLAELITFVKSEKLVEKALEINAQTEFAKPNEDALIERDEGTSLMQSTYRLGKNRLMIIENDKYYSEIVENEKGKIKWQRALRDGHLIALTMHLSPTDVDPKDGIFYQSNGPEHSFMFDEKGRLEKIYSIAAPYQFIQRLEGEKWVRVYYDEREGTEDEGLEAHPF